MSEAGDRRGPERFASAIEAASSPLFSPTPSASSSSLDRSTPLYSYAFRTLDATPSGGWEPIADIDCERSVLDLAISGEGTHVVRGPAAAVAATRVPLRL